MNIWDLAKEKLVELEDRSAKLEESIGDNETDSAIKRKHESHVLVCGSPNCGKSTLILKYLERNDTTKPTIALDYLFARRTRGKVKDVSNIWELGGGHRFTSLMRLPAVAENVEVLSFIIILDLSKPHELWITMERLVAAAREESEHAMQTLNTTDPAAFDRMKTVIKRRVKDYEEDLKLCSPLCVPLLIIGAKYDEFQNFESEQRRHICQCLRFAAYYYGASLMFYSSKMEQLVRQAKALCNHYVFDSSPPKGHVTDHSRPLFILCGGDSLQDIGMPPLGEGSFARASQPIQLWKEAFSFHFPQKENTEAGGEDPGADPLFREPLVDQYVERKTRDLEMYLKQKKDQQLAEQRAMQKISAL